MLLDYHSQQQVGGTIPTCEKDSQDGRLSKWSGLNEWKEVKQEPFAHRFRLNK